MAGHEESIVIQRPLGQVFAYMDDVEREHEWQPHLLEAEQTPSGPPSVGTRRRYVSEFMGKRLENTYVIRHYEPEKRIVLESTPDSVLRAKTDIRWAAEGEDTRVTMRLEGKPSGALRLLPRAVLEATFQKEVRSTLALLKQVLERADR